MENQENLNKEELKKVTGGDQDWSDRPPLYGEGQRVIFRSEGIEDVGTIYTVYQSWGLQCWCYGIHGDLHTVVPVREWEIIGLA